MCAVLCAVYLKIMVFIICCQIYWVFFQRDKIASEQILERKQKLNVYIFVSSDHALKTLQNNHTHNECEVVFVTAISMHALDVFIPS